MSHQSANATGSANSKPRAKLRGRGGRSALDVQFLGLNSLIATPAVHPAPNHLLDCLAPKGKRRTRAEGGERPGPASTTRIAFGAVLAASLGASPALAQDKPVDGPVELVLAAEPEGIPVGTLRLFPQLRADARYDSNVYNRETAERDDLILVARPSARLVTGWNRHAIEVEAGSEIRRYADNIAENSEQFAFRGSLRLDLAEQMTVNPSVLVARRIERRGSSGDQFLTDEPVSFGERSASVRFVRNRGLIGMSAGARASEFDYDDASVGGVALDQSFRDVRQRVLDLRISHGAQRRLSLFAAAKVNDTHYRRSLTERDSEGYSALAGVRYHATGLLQIEAAGGFLRQDFANPSTQDFTGLDFALAADWTPRPRIRVRLEGGRAVERSPSASEAAILQTRVEARGLHALGDRMLAGATFGFVLDDYRGSPRQERSYAGEATLDYRLTPALGLFGGVGYRVRNANGLAGRSYDGATVRLGLRFTP